MRTQDATERLRKQVIIRNLLLVTSNAVRTNASGKVASQRRNLRELRVHALWWDYRSALCSASSCREADTYRAGTDLKFYLNVLACGTSALHCNWIRGLPISPCLPGEGSMRGLDSNLWRQGQVRMRNVTRTSAGTKHFSCFGPNLMFSTHEITKTVIKFLLSIFVADWSGVKNGGEALAIIARQ